ncbi:hypothetical protein C2S52_011172 [Perilla frutescens var. hirtella]|nr:hypothetical protein C2S52_011172 [Perilla frutescens var. hirtella]
MRIIYLVYNLTEELLLLRSPRRWMNLISKCYYVTNQPQRYSEVTRLLSGDIVNLISKCYSVTSSFQMVCCSNIYIHDPNNEFPLSWKMHVRIAIEIAGALAYFHHAASVLIYHRDIKLTNILRSNQFTKKSYIYSLGVVLVELLTKARDKRGRSLVAHFMHSMEENKVFDLVDPEVVREGGADDTIAVVRLARRCLYLDSKKRPTMKKEVAVELEAIQIGKRGSVLQSYDEEKQFLSIEIYDSSSIISNTTNFNTTGKSSEFPLLYEKS